MQPSIIETKAFCACQTRGAQEDDRIFFKSQGRSHRVIWIVLYTAAFIIFPEAYAVF